MKRKLAAYLPDRLTVIGLFGLASLLFGVWQISRPASWIMAGVLILIYAILATAARTRREPKQ